MITSKDEALLFKFFDKKKDVIKQGNKNYIKQLYNEFIELYPNLLLSLDSFRYRIQLYRAKNNITLSHSRASHMRGHKVFQKLLDDNPDLLDKKHWMKDSRIISLLTNAESNALVSGCCVNANCLRQWMLEYKDGIRIL